MGKHALNGKINIAQSHIFLQLSNGQHKRDRYVFLYGKSVKHEVFTFTQKDLFFLNRKSVKKQD